MYLFKAGGRCAPGWMVRKKMGLLVERRRREPAREGFELGISSRKSLGCGGSEYTSMTGPWFVRVKYEAQSLSR